MGSQFQFKTPVEVSRSLAANAKSLRLEKKWTRETLSKRSGVPVSTLRKFEDTGKISLEGFLKISNALNRLRDMENLLAPPKISSIDELAKRSKPKRKRGSI